MKKSAAVYNCWGCRWKCLSPASFQSCHELLFCGWMRSSNGLYFSGMLVSNHPTCSLPHASTSNVRCSVPCSKQTTFTRKWLEENFEENALKSVPRSVMFEVTICLSSTCSGCERRLWQPSSVALHKIYCVNHLGKALYYYFPTWLVCWR